MYHRSEIREVIKTKFEKKFSYPHPDAVASWPGTGLLVFYDSIVKPLVIFELHLKFDFKN